MGRRGPEGSLLMGGRPFLTPPKWAPYEQGGEGPLPSAPKADKDLGSA